METSNAFENFILKAPYFAFYLISTSIVGITYIGMGLLFKEPIYIQAIVGGITFGASIVLGGHYRNRGKNDREI